MIIFHVAAALLSIGFSAYLFFRPSQHKLYSSYGLVAITVISGTVLIVRSSAHMLQTCLTGVVYIGVVSVLMAAAQYRLATQLASVSSQKDSSKK